MTNSLAENLVSFLCCWETGVDEVMWKGLSKNISSTHLDRHFSSLNMWVTSEGIADKVQLKTATRSNALTAHGDESAQAQSTVDVLLDALDWVGAPRIQEEEESR